jgi:demethylmenaquinone methyltransferase/2-methoxy-6-polyprenyl-1,4-benzoquinol methylase
MSEVVGETAMRQAYGAGAAAWADGPSLVYARLAATLVDHMPIAGPGASVVDLGAGTGVLSAALRRVGARPVACDFAWAMLAHDGANRPPAVTADARRLPLRDDSVDGVGAAFCLNHLTQPAAALREVARVTRPGGFVVSATYATTSGHPAKAAVDRAATELGFDAPAWYESIKTSREPLTDSADKVRRVALDAGLTHIEVDEQTVDVGVDAPELLVRWRLGMAALAAFAATLDDAGRDRLHRRALEEVGDHPAPYRPRVVMLRAKVASASA